MLAVILTALRRYGFTLPAMFPTHIRYSALAAALTFRCWLPV
ncbi:hypothetical protein ACLK19_27765 [Escherichia coli]